VPAVPCGCAASACVRSSLTRWRACSQAAAAAKRFCDSVFPGGVPLEVCNAAALLLDDATLSRADMDARAADVAPMDYA
jgi:hypothetical protein